MKSCDGNYDTCKNKNVSFQNELFIFVYSL